MASSLTFDEVVSLIFERSGDAALQSHQEYVTNVKAHFEESTKRYPAMQGKSLLDIYKCQGDRSRLENYTTRFLTAPPPSSALWDAVMELDVHALHGTLSSRTEADKLVHLLISDKFRLSPLGKLYGTEQCWLEVDYGSLRTEVDEPKPAKKKDSYRFANTLCGAISYPDGHPSEGSLALTVDDDAEKLRRWVSLGYLLTGPPGKTHHTGHVLVIDVEPGRNLNHWIILASKYPNDSGEPDYDGSDLISVPEVVDRDDPDTDEGVLPGDRNRTPVARIKALSGPSSTLRQSVVRLFGPDFNFTVIRRGSERGYMRSIHGPALPHIMCWYNDPATGDQLCYSKDGQEYMRFHPASREISYAKRAFESFAGKIGAHGEIVDQGGFVPLSQRMARLGSGGITHIRYREVSSSMGF